MTDEIYRKERHEIASSGLKWISRYDIPSAELQNMQQTQPAPMFVQVLDLTTAKTPGDPLIVNVPGRAFTLLGYTLSSAYNETANTGVEQVEPAVFVNARVNLNRQEYAYPLKHNRGFRGEFVQLFLSWPAQPDFGAKLVIYKHDLKQWENQESDNRFNSVEASQIDTLAVATTGAAAVLLPLDLRRKISTIQNNHATEAIYVGDSTVTTATGIKVAAAGGILYYRNTAELWAVSTGANNDVRLVTEY